MRAHTLLILALAAAPLPALAQNQVPVNRSQQAVEGINRSIESRAESRGIQQQNRFETNQLQGQIQRQQSLPPPPAPIIVPSR
ncbi:hypothetical protein [Methylobacterium frigidaeris]|uniref:Uncharacterized protein n=1 Tax=Methylobacterium frigidaeris TaxID=2038277 RepID=A0AA37HHM5_9HYPH|nr:hypothetical protein [Methylobacterium frigidaeris]PIK70292.1 hypothetical protein CS379_25400 [Methylobacterium frigidaeris]GJD66125.1 hypothetical protein MPEAHAMD_6321 [Methylobacterium frigidaeris]